MHSACYAHMHFCVDAEDAPVTSARMNGDSAFVQISDPEYYRYVLFSGDPKAIRALLTDALDALSSAEAAMDSRERLAVFEGEDR